MNTISLHKYPVYLLLLPVFYFLHNFNQLPFLFPFDGHTLYPFLKMIGAAVVGYGLVFFTIKSHAKTAIVIFFCSILLCYFGVFHDFMKALLGKSVFASYKAIIPLAILGLAFLMAYLLRREKVLRKWIQYLTVLTAVLVGYELIFFTVNIFRYVKNKNLIDNNFSISNEYISSRVPESKKPDIYFLVFDEMTNSLALQQLWNFNNTNLDNWLNTEGFHVVDSGKANYDFTPYSVSSMLNMNYIEERKAINGTSPLLMLQGIRSIGNNQVFDICKKEGYQFHFLAPFNNSINQYNGVREFDDFPYIQMYGTTLFYRLQEDILWNFPWVNKLFSKSPEEEEQRPSYGNYRRRVRDVVSTINNIKATVNSDSNRAPRFVYGHLMITHEPHLFDSSGNPKSDDRILRGKEQFNSYVDQVRYANKVIRELVTTIKTKNKKNTIIIIAGDHGFRHLPTEKEAWHFHNFNALYLPNRDYRQVYGTMSPVNIFRIVFNNAFQQQYPLLKDTSVKVNYQVRE
jgi:Sulfatase